MMNQKKTKKELYFYESLIIIAYLGLGFVPNLNAIDRIAPQWLGMAILNIVSSIYLIKNYKSFSPIINGYLKSLITILYGLFILWAGISFFYALNGIEVLVNLSRHFNIFFMLTIMTIVIHRIKNKEIFFSTIITIILGVESIAIINDAIEMLNSSGEIVSGLLKGVTANRNIAAFSIALKIPFVLYLIASLKSIKIKGLLSAILALAIFDILIIQSRASYLALGLIVIAFLFQGFYFFEESKAKKIKLFSFLAFPLLLAILVNQTYFASKGADALSRASTITFSTNDGSVNQRLRYYEDVLTHITSNPILGVGLGNWKFKSIDYDKKDIFGYTVPYHAHSDFIQLGAELGIIGFFLYLTIFLIVFIRGFKIIFSKNNRSKEILFSWFLLTSFGVYFIDANLNFPIARPQVLIIWAFIVAVISINYNSLTSNIIPIKYSSRGKYFMIILSLIALVSLFISNKVHESLKNQMYLLRDFNTAQYKTSLSDVIAMDLSIPNVTVTTIPMVDIKARYLINAKKYNEALKLLNKDKNANPFLYYKESLMSTAHEKAGNIDSAYYYAKKAYKGLPNNEVHVAKFLNFAMAKKDLEAIKFAASNLMETHSKTNWQNILTAYVDLVGHGDKKLISLTEKAVKLFPYETNIIILKKLANVSAENISKAQQIEVSALSNFNEKNYKQAVKLYIEASNYNPMEYSYLENAATSFFLLEDFGNAILYSGKVIENLNPGTGKSEYIHGVAKLSVGDNQGCDYISKSMSFGFDGAKKTYDENCR